MAPIPTPAPCKALGCVFTKRDGGPRPAAGDPQALTYTGTCPEQAELPLLLPRGAGVPAAPAALPLAGPVCPSGPLSFCAHGGGLADQGQLLGLPSSVLSLDPMEARLAWQGGAPRENWAGEGQAPPLCAELSSPPPTPTFLF